MTKITKYLRSVEEIKKELEEHPENIKHYMGYMGYESQYEGSLDYIKEKIEEHLKKEKSHVTVFSDSKYVVDAFEKKWLDGWIKKNFKNVKNVDLWMRMLKIYKKHHVKFVWVKGHASNVENNRCDELAVAAYKQPNLKTDHGYEDSQKDVFSGE